MRFKRRRNCVPIRTLTFGVDLLIILILILNCVSASFYQDSAILQSALRPELIFITGVGLATFQRLIQADASSIQTPQIIPDLFTRNENISQFVDNSTLQTKYFPSQTNSSSDKDESHPRRLTKLPKIRSKSFNRKPKVQAPESAMNRARLLLGSLNRQNCFAKVLCGLGAREPTTKTGLLNDYVYLMEEFVLDDEPDEPKTKSKSKKRKKHKKNKVHTKKDKDDSDSSMSKSDEDDKATNDDLEDKLTDWNFLADETLAQEDPQVLKYVQLEEKRRQYKDQLPNELLLKRTGRDGVSNGTNGNQEIIVEEPIQLVLPPKSNLRLARQMADEVRTGKTFGTRRQCRTFSNRCPFDDIQMNEIITNLKKMLTGRDQQQQFIGSASKTTTTVTANGVPGGQVQTITQPQGGGGSKVEIVLHLNQNGMPYGGYPMPMPMPMHFNPHLQQQTPAPRGNITSQNVSNSGSGLAAPHPPWPQLQLGGASDPRYPLGHPGMMYQPPMYYPPLPPTTIPTTTTTTTEPTTTTMRSPGEEQLLDFLYGVVNFNESAADPEIDTDIATKQQNPSATNPYWSAANIALAQAQDVEHELKIRDRDPDRDDDSNSSEEQELKVYIKSLKNTLKGLAQMNNVTIIPEQEQVQHSSEEKEAHKDDSSQEDSPIPGDDFPIPGVVDEGNSDENEDNDDEDDGESVELEQESAPKKKVRKVIKKKKVATTLPSQILIAIPASKGNVSTTSPTHTPSEQLFDEDNDDNVNEAMKKLIEKNDPKVETSKDFEDDEYLPEDNASSSTSGEEGTGVDDFDEESDENSSTLSKTQKEKEQDDLDALGVSKEDTYTKRQPPNILLKFEPIPPEKDPEEMTAKEKNNLAALSAALLPKVPDTFATSPNQRQPIKDVLEEIRIPTAKPLVKAFQSVANIGKHKIINIDEFADDSGKNPIFPRKKKAKKGTRPQKMRYQTRRKPPMRRPLRVPPRKIKSKNPTHSNSNSESSEEEFTGGARGDFQFDSDEQNRTSSSKCKQGYSSKTGPLISFPLHPPSGTGTKHQTPDFYDSLMNYMGMKPVVSKKELPAPASNEFQYGYGSEEPSEPNRGKSDFPMPSSAVSSFTKAQLKAQPKIGISIPLEFDLGRDAVVETIGEGWGEDKKGEDEGKKKDKKKKGKDKDKKKKDKKKKDKKKKKKKKGKKNKGSGGYAMQFHQQVHTHEEPGIWDKIKVFVDTLASTQKGAGETPFIHLGFSETDPLDGGPHAVINDKGGSSPPVYDSVKYAGGGGDDDDDTAEEEEEDDIPAPKRRRPPTGTGQREELDLENSSAISGPEYEGIDYDENNEEESNESPEIPSTTKIPPLTPEVPYSPLPAQLPTPIPTPNQVRQVTETPTTPTTQKTTIAPKPPKYIVDRQQLKIKKKRKKQKKKAENFTTVASPPPPIMLLVTSSATTTLPPPTTTTTDPPTTSTQESMFGKPPKRKIIYRPPPKRVNIASPGTLLLLESTPTTSTLKPMSSSSLKSTPADWIKTRVEDDEMEPPSHFFQPGPNGVNVWGRPPIRIDAFHIQSEDMLIDTEEDEKLRGGIRPRPRPHRQRPLPPFFAQPYGLQLRDGNSGGGSGSQEQAAEEEGSSPESDYLSSSILIATPRPRPSFQVYPESIDINPEETRASVTKSKKHKTKLHRRPTPSYQHKKEQEASKDLAVMNSPIFSNYFKHLYSSFGQYLSSPAVG